MLKLKIMKNLILTLSIIASFFSLQAQQITPDVINSLGGSSQYSGGYLASSVGEPVIGTSMGSNTTLTQGFLQTWKKLSKQIALKLFLEGLYAGSSQMNQARNATAPEYGTGISDRITVELHNASSPYGLAYSYSNTDLHTDGVVNIDDVPAGITGSYFIVVKHRNSIETWSKLPLDFSTPSDVNYDFSTAASMAFGNNLKQMGTVFAIYAGDETQDGFVDVSDMSAIDNASTAIQKGYYPEDINGDGIVDVSDMSIIDNNSTAIVHKIMP
jgi:hypothetical protein